MLQMGKLYEQGLGVEQSADEAARWYKSAADGGNQNVLYFPFPELNNSRDDTNTTTNDEDAAARDLISSLSYVVIVITFAAVVTGILALSDGSDKAVPFIYIVSIVCALWMLHLFFRALAEIIKLLLDIKTILKKTSSG